MKPITKVLIANRGEVALRVQATCHAQGLATVAVYAHEDCGLRYAQQASESYQLTGTGGFSFLNQAEILAIAKISGADAIHPGYGFLAENADFAEKVIAAGLAWIGPAPACMRAMGSKQQARLIAQQAGVPVTPGLYVTDLSATGCAQAQKFAVIIGYPIMLKDPCGGGGKGMRRVDGPAELEAAWRLVCAEMAKFTQGTAILVEKYVLAGRHIEVQVAGDGMHAVHLFERECSLQRRNQKIIEEAPCAFIADTTKQALYQAALSLVRAVNYDSIGTVEFMVAGDSFYFLEMNTRLQVEHGVTELITGIDLVALQLRIANLGTLGMTQQDITQRGHAIQCRIYAEDPEHNFMPVTGTIDFLRLPQHQRARLEHDLQEGQAITPFFDPMIAKILALGSSRLDALGIMHVLLQQFSLGSLVSNRDFLQVLVAHPVFYEGDFHTQKLADQAFMQDLLARMITMRAGDCERHALVAGLAALLAEQLTQKVDVQGARVIGQRRWLEQQWQ